MCCNYSICWLPIIKGGKLVWYNVVVTNFCSNFCGKTTRSRENTHYLLTYVVGCGVVSQHLWCFSAWVAHYAAVLGCYKPPLGVSLHDPS